jgi:hypothetical protein
MLGREILLAHPPETTAGILAAIRQPTGTKP